MAKRRIKTGKEADKYIEKLKKIARAKEKAERKKRASKYSGLARPQSKNRGVGKLSRRVAGKAKKNIQKKYKGLGGGKKGTKRRERASRGILTAAGVIRGKQTYAGAGRPRGTYKYGMPIAVYKRNLREKKALYQKYQQEQYARLRPKGFSPEQVQALQQQQTYQELEEPSRSRVQRVQERVQQMQRPGFRKMRVDTNMHSKLVQPGPSVADDELAFRKWSSETSISPRTQRMLDTIRRIQNKGKQDNIEQQRRLRERNMVGRSMNLMKAHENMINTDMDFTGVDPEQNILMAPSVFKENPDDVILRNTRGSLGILNTKEAGNDLHF